MKELIVYLFLFFIMNHSNLHAQAKDETAVATAIKSLYKAMVDADSTDMDKWASPDLSYGHSSNKGQDKKTFISAITSGASDFVTIDLSDETIKVTGNTAIARHILTAQTNDGGKPGNVHLGILLVWQKQNGDWKLLARQAVKIQ